MPSHPSRFNKSHQKPRTSPLLSSASLTGKKEGSGTPTGAVLQPPHRCGCGTRPCLFVLTLAREVLEGARSPIGVPPRLSPKGVIVPKAQLQARLPGTWSERALPAFACPSPASTSRPGHNAGRLMPKPPGSSSDEPPPAGTASRSDQPGSPADVLHGERDCVPLFKSPRQCQRFVAGAIFVQGNLDVAWE